MKKLTRLIAGIFILAFALTSFAYAFGVSSPYWKDNPLKLAPGESIEFALKLQITGDSPIKATVAEGGETAKIIDSSDIYYIIPGEMTPVNIKVTAPNNAKPGDVIKIRISFITTTPASQSGSFSFGSGIDQKFDLVITEQPQVVQAQEEADLTWVLYLSIAILIVIIIIIVVLINKKKQK